jgi:ferric-dicitrate binding protein FerR (iron transport regulator)
MENKMQLKTLINKLYLETLTKEETISLLNSLKDKEPQHEVLRFLQDTWDEAEEYNNEIDSRRLYNQTLNRIGTLDGGLKISEGSPNKNNFIGSKVSSIMRYAAVFLLAFGLSWLVHLYFWNRPTTLSLPMAEQVQTIEVPYGSKTRIVLPDNSVVNLNSGSSLKYSNLGFNSGSRSVFLTGEGFFSISKDSARPFYVTTTGIKLKVLGTCFNLKAYPDENSEEATLVSGMVEIYASSDKAEEGKAIVLKPNQKAVFLKSKNDFSVGDAKTVSPPITSVKLRAVQLQLSSETEQTTSWKENTLIFDNEPFSSLVIRIERWYNVKILVNYPKLNSVRFTGKFDKETVEQVLTALVTVTPFNYTIKQNLITISEK